VFDVLLDMLASERKAKATDDLPTDDDLPLEM
jgi:hypothetical protein